MKRKILQLITLCAIGLGFSGCVVHSSGTYAHVGGEIYASSGDYYGHRYHKVPPKERVVIVPQQRVVVVPQKKVVVAPKKTGVVRDNRSVLPPKYHATRSNGKFTPSHKNAVNNGIPPRPNKDFSSSQKQNLANLNKGEFRPHTPSKNSANSAKTLPPYADNTVSNSRFAYKR